MKTNIKSKKFYAEAENMETGWGDHLKSIDKLKDKVEQGKDISLNEACWVLWAEVGCCSAVWQVFKEYCVKMRLRRKRVRWEIWYGIFCEWKNNPLTLFK
jgi:hypothetical protein